MTYTITCNLNGGVISNVNPSMYTIKTPSITLNAPSRTGYTFAGWYTDSLFSGTAVSSINTGSVGDIILYAKWNVDHYTITYYLDGGINGSNPSEYTIETPVITLVNPTRTGAVFAGWYTDSLFSGTAVTLIASGSTGNIVLYAKWTLNVYTIIYHLNGGTDSSGNPSTYTVETPSITLGSPARTGYVFDGWYTSAAFNDSSVMSINAGSVGDITLYAKWIIRDVDGNVYTEVTIGTQTWMVENFRCTKFNDGTSMLLDTAYSYYDNTTNVDSIKKYGALYSWPTVHKTTFAPNGWHVPTEAEWKAMNQTPISLASTSGWTTNSTAGTPGYNQANNNTSGFTAYPGGRRWGSSDFREKGSAGYWWTSDLYVDEIDPDPSLGMGICIGSYTYLYYTSYNEWVFLSARLVRDY